MIHYKVTVLISTYYAHGIKIYKVPTVLLKLDLIFLLQLEQDDFCWTFYTYLLLKK
jgi:hypothetical protein